MPSKPCWPRAPATSSPRSRSTRLGAANADTRPRAFGGRFASVRARALVIVALAGCQPGEMPEDIAGTSGDAPLVAPEGSLLRDPFIALPRRLSETGLYLSLPDRTIVPDAAIAYEPLWPLWSNGSDKQRFL